MGIPEDLVDDMLHMFPHQHASFPRFLSKAKMTIFPRELKPAISPHEAEGILNKRRRLVTPQPEHPSRTMLKTLRLDGQSINQPRPMSQRRRRQELPLAKKHSFAHKKAASILSIADNKAAVLAHPTWTLPQAGQLR